MSIDHKPAKLDTLLSLLEHCAVEINSDPKQHVHCPFPDRDIYHANGDATASFRVEDNRGICVCNASKWGGVREFVYRMLGGGPSYDDEETWSRVEGLFHERNLSRGEDGKAAELFLERDNRFYYLKVTTKALLLFP